MYLLTGITGKVGGATARALHGNPLRGFVRTPDKVELTGVELVAGDLADSDALARAMRGCEAVFAMVPPTFTPGPDFAQSRAYAASIRRAIDLAGPTRVVVLSSHGADRSSGTGLILATHYLEQALWDVPNVAFVRAGGFFENFARPLRTAQQTGVLDTFIPAAHASAMIAIADIGTEVAKLMSTTWTGRRIIELGTAYSHEQIAAAMTHALGTPVVARTIPREHWDAAFAAMQLSPDGVANFREMETGIASGHIAFGAPGAERVAGTTTPDHVFSRLDGRR